MSTRPNWYAFGISILSMTLVVALSLTLLSAQDDPASWVGALIGGNSEKSRVEEVIADRNDDPLNEVADSNSYAFATATAGTLTDMSTGTTQLVGANIDDTASGVRDIGFDFYFMGVRYTTFGVNDNGVLRLGANSQTSTPYQPLAQLNIPIITAYGADQRTHAGDGKVHFKVIGAAPNRTLVIEWLNMQSNFNTGGTADLTYQVRLNESTGVIEYVYGSMTMSTIGAADTNSNDPHIGYSSSNLANTVGSVTAPQAGSPTFNGTSNDPVENLYVAGPITVLTSASDGIRRTMSFTPPVPAAPTGLNFTGVTALSITLNWTDSANEVLYAIYRSTDGTNYSFVATAAENATSYVDSNVLPGTTYFYRVFAASEGALSTALSGSQATSPAGNVSCAGAGGLWNTPSTWVTNSVPTAADNVTIGTGCTVTIDSSNAFTVTIQSGGILEFEATTARTLTVTDDVTIDSGGTFRSNAAGTVTTHVLSVGGDLTNNGAIDFSTNTNTAAAGITFTSANNATFTLGGSSTTDLKQTGGVTVNKGTNNTPVLSFNPGGTLTVLGANTAGFLTITNGTFKMDGTGTFSNPLFSVAAYAVPSTGGLWMNNPNATVVGQNGSPTVTGRFQMTAGTHNVGTGTGNSIGFATGSNILIEGGAVNTTGRFNVTASGNAITYNQTGGTITTCTVGHTSTTLACFDLGTGVGTTNITAGNIVIQTASTAASGPRDYRNQSGLTGTTTVTGGTVQFGNASTPAVVQAFDVAGVFPDVVVDNTTAAHTVTMLAPAVFNNITRNVLVNTGTTFNVGNNVFLLNGTTFTNNGTLTGNGASTNFVIFLTSAAVTYTGTGTVTVPLTNLAVQADGGSFTIDAATSGINVNAVRLFSGNIINANELTIGSGGITTATVQIGNTTTPTNAGTFDTAPTFNPGTGGIIFTYLRTGGSRTTGPEVPATRSITRLTYDDNAVGRTLTIAGGDLTMTESTTALALTNGRVVTGANTLIVSSGTAAVTRTTGSVDGNLRKTFDGAANKTFEVGTANGYSPVAVNVTAGTFPATFQAKAVQGPHPAFGTPSLALSRYWTLTEGGDVTADLTFNYLDPTDIPVTATEANFVIFKHDGAFTMPGGTVTPAANTASITGVTSFSDWTLAEPGATGVPGTLQFNAPTYTVGEAGPTATITVTRTGGTDGAVSVDYASVAGGTATGGAVCGGLVDYVNASGTLNWANGDGADKTFSVTICDDAADEPDETVNLQLSNAMGGATIGSQSTAVMTITDNDVSGPTCEMPSIGNIEVQATAGTMGPTGYATLADAFTAINTNVHQGVITIDVCGNTTETASAILNASGAGGTYTSVAISPVGGPRIIEGTIVGGVVKLNGADNVTIDGRIDGVGRNLTIRNNSTATATAAIWLASVAAGNGASNNVIRNLEVAAGASANINTNTTIGILMGGTTISLTSTDGNDNDNNQFIFNRITKARYGLATRGVTTNNSLGLVITDNIIGPTSFGPDEIGKAGIYLQADTGAVVSGNTVQFVGGDIANTTAGADRCGICIGSENWSATDSTTITSGDYTVTKNIVHDVVDERTFSAMGIRLGTTRSGVATNNLVANNFIYNLRANGTAGDQVLGIGISNGHTDRIEFNSISITGDMDPGASGSSTQYGNAIRVPTANGTNNANFSIRNNSIYMDVSSNTATVHFYAITLNSSAYAFGTGALNYNNYYVNQANAQMRTGGLSAATGASATTEFQTLANWQTALTTPQDANSIQSDPLYFSNSSDLHIQTASPNINVGLTIAGIADDIDAQVRPNGANPDIGADEFYPSPGSVQLSSATYSVTEFGLTATITVTRTGGFNGAISVDYATAVGGSATGGAACTAGVDYISTSGTLMWADLDGASKTFTVTVCNDGVPEGSETVNLALTNPMGGVTLGTPNTAVLTILNSTTFGSTVSVGSSEAITSLTNPGGLFDQINTGALTSNLTANITSDLTVETGAVALNQFSGGFSLTIQPSGGSRTISGANPTVLIDINGADNVHFLCNAGGGLDMLIRNTGVGTGTVVRFINDASNNTVLVCTLEGGGTSSVLLISTGVTTGNDNISITGNIIRDRTDVTSVPFNSINLIGTSAAVANSNINIHNNQLINFTQAGMVIGTSENVEVVGNQIFQTAPRTTALFGVAVNSAFGTNLFSGNTVHDMTTTLATTGMQFNDARATTVSRNRIYNFPSTSGSTGTLTGILFNGATGTAAAVTVANNMVSLIPGFTNAQSIFGIRDFAFAGNTFSSYFNTVLISGTGSGASNTWACQRGFSAPTAYTMIDNICFNNRTGGTGNHFAAGDQSSNTGTFVSNYNIFVGTGATAANFFDKATSSTAVPVNFATWQAGPPTRDANSQASNPGGNYTVANMFISPTDLHLNTSGTNPASNAGTPAGGITTDFDGETRSVATPDIGADEVGPTGVPGTLQFSSATYTVGEAGGTSTITVTRTGGTDGTVTVDFATVAGGTATGGAACTAGIDYINTSGTLTFVNGDASETFDVTICNDSTDEPDETINMALSNPTGGATIGAQSTAVLTITDDDPPPGSISINDVRMFEGNSGTVNFVFTVTYTGPPVAVSVQYATANGTAVAGPDYAVASGTLFFNPPIGPNGIPSQTQTVTVVVNGDLAKEANETFFVNLSNPTSATISDGQGVGIIIDEDRAYVSDFDRDLIADFSVFRPSEGNWYVLQSTNATPKIVNFGTNGDIPVPGDYDADGLADYAVWRPSNGNWYRLLSSDSSQQITEWGLPGDKPVQGDYDGDAKTDLAIYRPSTGTWWIIRSSTGTNAAIPFGISTDRPVQGDYDGDAKTDIAVYRDGTWYIARSSDAAVQISNWGIASDRPVSGDFDGDGRFDLAIYRDGAWWVFNSLTSTVSITNLGNATDIPVPADYDADGTTDRAVFRPSTGDWYVIRSSDSTLTGVHWGVSGDVPIPKAYLPQ